MAPDASQAVREAANGTLCKGRLARNALVMHAHVDDGCHGQRCDNEKSSPPNCKPGCYRRKIEIDNPMTTFRGFAFFCSGPSEINAHLKILQIMENMPLHIADHSSPLNPPPAMLRKESQDTARDRPVLMTTHGPPQKQQH